jgi:pimeloyl-ACP methyl ester carboxylesterase
VTGSNPAEPDAEKRAEPAFFVLTVSFRGILLAQDPQMLWAGSCGMKHIEAGALDVAYAEFGPQDGKAVILLHGFPYDIHAYDEVCQRLSRRGLRCIVPFLRGYGATRFLSDATPRSGQQAALGSDLVALMDALSIPEAILGGYDWGGRAACIVSALWSDRAASLVSCGTGYNIQNIAAAGTPASPEDEHRFWYQYYFHGERGRAGLDVNRRALCRLIWKLWSPDWTFDEVTFERSAISFDNPDFVDVVIHSYRHRFGLAAGDPALDAIEKRLAAQPDIAVPTIVLQGGGDGVDPPASEDDIAAPHFRGRYERRILPGIGHNLPRRRPKLSQMPFSRWFDTCATTAKMEINPLSSSRRAPVRQSHPAAAQAYRPACADRR